MQTKSILAKTAVVISLCALCSSVFAAPTSKGLTKSEELYPQGWTVGDQIKFKKGTTASLNDNGAVIRQVIPICVHKGGSVLLTIIILFLHILTAARFSRVITDIGTITVPTI
jgi:hypothetical protein